MNAKGVLSLAALLLSGLCAELCAQPLGGIPRLELGQPAVRAVLRKPVPFAELAIPQPPAPPIIEIERVPGGPPQRPALQLELQTSRQTYPVRGLRRPLPQNAPADAPGAQASDRLHLLQGDQFIGKLMSFVPGEGLHWQHPSIKAPMVLDAQSLSRVQLRSLSASPNAKRHSCIVALANGDELMGELLELRAEKAGQPAALVLDTWYAGKLTLPFAGLRSLTPGNVGTRVLYEGPENAAGWLSGANNQVDPNGNVAGLAAAGGMPMGDVAIQIAGRMAEQPGAAQWRFANNSFQARGTGAIIARDFELPDRCMFEFDLAWQGYFSLTFNFYTDKFDQYSGNCYSLRFDQQNAYLFRISPTMGNVRLGANVNTGLTLPRTSARISVRVDKAARTIAMLVDGVLVHQWKEEGGRDFAGKGKGVLFATRNAQPMRLGAIRVAEWDGRLPVAGNVVGAGKEDFVLFSNEDSVSGNVLAIKDSKLTLQTGFGDLEVPLQRVGRVDFRPRPIQVVAANGRATLRDQGRITFNLKQWKDGKVIIASPYFGEAEFLASAFAAMEFNTDQPRKEGTDTTFP